MTIALVGNPNSGKSTLFNTLTGLHRKVGNYPGITVDIKIGRVKDNSGMTVTDLPGLYSLEPFSNEEKVTCEYLKNEKPDLIINVADAACLRRSLYLTLQLTELSVPMITVLNMTDILEKRGGSVNTKILSDMLGVPVISASAVRKSDVRRLVGKARELCSRPHIIPPRGSAPLSDTARHACAERICRAAYSPPAYDRRTARLDRVLAGKITALPILAGIMAAVFFLSFIGVGARLSDALAGAVDIFSAFAGDVLRNAGAAELFTSLVVDGIFKGVGAVISFLPIIAVLFFLISLLEDSGYMARAAFITDRPLKKAGLSGRGFLPLTMGFGCSVPAIMAARTAASGKERILMVLAVPFMSCSAKIPVYAAVTSLFFGRNSGIITAFLYLFGIVAAVCVSGALSALCKDDRRGGFVLELPPYRIPSLKNALLFTLEKCGGFIKKAFTVILAASALIWALKTFNASLDIAQSPDESLIALVGRALSPVFAPLGFGDWRVAAALITGCAAKENILSTIAVLAGGTAMKNMFDGAAGAAAFLVFVLLYTPCSAALAAIKKELGKLRYAVFAAVGQLAFAWVISFIIYRLVGVFA